LIKEGENVVANQGITFCSPICHDGNGKKKEKSTKEDINVCLFVEAVPNLA
jgi:hypothetical protein